MYNKFLNKVAADYPDNTMLFGTTLIQKGKVYDVKNDFFEFDNKKIYVASN